MAKKAIERTKPNNRPKSVSKNETVIIRWELLENFIKAGYNGKEIAEKFGVSFTTLQRRCKKEQGLLLGDYIRKSPERIIEQFDMPENVGSKFTTWDRINKMLEAGCPGTEIAATFGMDPEYFAKLIRIKYKESLTDTRKQKKLKGDAQLRIRQYDLAMKGDRQMLTILGKDRLSQVEKQEISLEHKIAMMPDEELNSKIAELERKINL